MPGAGYSRAQIRLHWLVVLLVALQLLLPHSALQAFQDRLDATGVVLGVGAMMHFGCGALILVLVALRLALRQEQGIPAPGRPGARILHFALYAVLLLLPVTGALAWVLSSAQAGLAHYILKRVLIGLILTHVGVVLYEQFVLRTNIMQRMIRPRR
ncbi:cytochrome b/b6 domain-containing protein [Actibacterium sp. D379-3]